MAKGTDSPGLGSLAGAALTALSAVIVTAFAAVIGVVIAREFGRTDETDGFFAAYGVYIVLLLASQSIRIAVLPSLARAREERRLAGTITGFAVAIACVAAPLALVFELGAESIARVLTGDGSSVAVDSCAEALRWMIPAAIAHLFAGLAASGLAALDDYATPAFGYALGSAVGPAYILSQIDDDGLAAVSRGILLNGLVALLVPALVLGWKAWRSRMPAGAVRPAGERLLSRLGLFATAAALPIALQLLYVVCLPFAGRLGSGAVTSFGYAYLMASSFVSVTAFSIGLVSSVPLTRQGLGTGAAARHVVSSSWVAFVLIAPAVGVFALTGGDVIERVLGGAYGGDVGAEIGRIIVLLAAWMVASVGVNVAFPLAFVAERLSALPLIGVLALALQLLLAWVGSELFELTGLAIALALSTLFVLAALLRELDALELGVRGVAVAALVIGGLALAAFLPAALVLGAAFSALAGLVLYVVLVTLVRPRELKASWAYLRALR